MAEAVISCALRGNPGNVMFAYLAALRLRNLLGEGTIVGVDLPMWNLQLPGRALPDGVIRLSNPLVDRDGRGLIPAGAIASLLRRRQANAVEISAYCQHTGNLPDRGSLDADRLFDGRAVSVESFGADTLVISVRGGEILDAIHPDYTLLPVSFYVELIERTRLTPVFVGQLAPNAYVDALRTAFPDARYLSGPTPLHDFERLRAATNICLSVSTFAWMAAWLSDAKRIVLPLSGLFNPSQHRTSWFIPDGDERYEYVVFPINRAVPVGRFRDAHDPIEGRWRWMTEDDVVRAFAGPARRSRRLDSYLGAFDQSFYRRTVAGMADASASAAIEHYIAGGFRHGTTPFEIDTDWYVRRYPDAAEAIGCNTFEDAAHHYVECGRALGYEPVRPLRVADHEARTITREREHRKDSALPLDPLTTIAIRHGSDKYGGHLYTPTYHRLFASIRNDPVRMLEIGVGGYEAERAGGLSLRMWAEYFPNAQITGLDISRKSIDIGDRVQIFQGSQDDPAILKRLVEQRGPFDIVLDDGSHQVRHMLATFAILYPLMTENGIYLIEDTQTSFLPALGGQPSGHGTVFDLAHRLSLAMHALEGFSDPDVTSGLVALGRMTESVSTYRNVSVFRRGANTYPSNMRLSFDNQDVCRVYDGITAAAALDPAPGSSLSRIDMLIWAGRTDEAAKLAVETIERVDEESVLHEVVRLMEWARAEDAKELAVAKLRRRGATSG